jgi:hypothetical protein
MGAAPSPFFAMLRLFASAVSFRGKTNETSLGFPTAHNGRPPSHPMDLPHDVAGLVFTPTYYDRLPPLILGRVIIDVLKFTRRQVVPVLFDRSLAHKTAGNVGFGDEMHSVEARPTR